MSDSPPYTDGSSDISRRDALQAATAGAGVLFTGVSLTGPSLGTKQEDDETDVIHEEAWVETGTDTDDTGESDRVYVAITRPKSTEDDGEQLPVVVRPDPYYTPPGSDEYQAQDVLGDFDSLGPEMERELYRPEDDGVAVANPAVLPGSSPGPLLREMAVSQTKLQFYRRELVRRGYVFLHASPLGSFKSTGCNVLGGPAAIRGMTAIVDWVNGRATAYDARQGGDTVEATWTTGKTGMIGGSYRGTLANGAGATGVDGLETIVPIRAISSWYSYVRTYGAVTTPGNEGESGSAGLAWLASSVTTRKNGERCRDVLTDIQESLDHETGNYNDFWAERDYVRDVGNVDASVLLVHGLYDVQVRPTDFSRWLAALKRQEVPYRVWLHRGGHIDPRERHPDRWLELLERWFDYWLKGEDNGVMDEPAALVEYEDGSLVEQADWPHPESQSTTFGFEPRGERLGLLTPSPSTGSVTESLVDNSELPPTEFAGMAHPAHRLVYRTPELTDSLRVSGTVKLRVELAFDAPAALVSAALVDYGPDGPKIVNRGWMNPLNRESLTESQSLEPGEPYELQFALEPVDYRFDAGHRLGIMLYSSDYNVTRRPPSSPELTLSLAESKVYAPIVGGEAAVTDAAEYAELEAMRSTETQTPASSTPTDSEPAATATDHSQDTESTDGDGPGFGIVSALSALGGTGYLLKRRLERTNE
jgi:X-Pro dipeptidyl-peptidase